MFFFFVLVMVVLDVLLVKFCGCCKFEMFVVGLLEIVLFDGEVCGIGCLMNEDGMLGKVVFVEGVLLGEWVMYCSYCVKFLYE